MFIGWASNGDERPSPDWQVCSRHEDDGCIGIQIGTTAYCLAHLEHGDPEEFKAFLVSLRPGASLDLRGTRLSAGLLNRLLPALKPDKGQPTIGPSRFNRVHFSGRTNFNRAQFDGSVYFDGAQFDGDAWFDQVQFDGEAYFEGVQFGGDASFTGVQFRWDVWFNWAQFSRDAWFNVAQFSKDVWFIGTQFKAATVLGPFRAHSVCLDRASFVGSALIEVAAVRLSMVGTRFEQEAALRVRYSEVCLEAAVFTKPASLAFAETPFSFRPHFSPSLDGASLWALLTEAEGFNQRRPLDETPLKQAGLPPRPRLLSLRRVDATNLVLGDLDLTWCLFRGAHNLDKLRIEGIKHFATTPFGWRWTQRRTLAEEQQWRHKRHPRQGWIPPSDQALGWVGEQSGQPVQEADPDHVAPLYRALRKAEEDAKYEPGAADFYYGEMEMRRHAHGTPWIEKRLLWAYWLVAGYGLRASRALLTLLVVLVAATAILAAVGFPAPAPPANRVITGTITGGSTVQHLRLDPSPPPPVPQRSFVARCGTAWWIALEAAVFRSPDQTLTPAGRHVQTVVRFFGPVLLGLALLSVRGRVKR